MSNSSIYEVDSSQQNSDLLQYQEEQDSDQIDQIYHDQNYTDDEIEEDELKELRNKDNQLVNEYYEQMESESVELFEEKQEVNLDFEKMSYKKRIKILKEKTPDVLKMIKELTDTNQILLEELKPLLSIERVRTTLGGMGEKYLKGKISLLNQYIKCIIYYIYLKQKQLPDFEEHPVIIALIELKQKIESLQDIDLQFQKEMQELLQDEINQEKEQVVYNNLTTSSNLQKQSEYVEAQENSESEVDSDEERIFNKLPKKDNNYQDFEEEMNNEEYSFTQSSPNLDNIKLDNINQTEKYYDEIKEKNIQKKAAIIKKISKKKADIQEKQKQQFELAEVDSDENRAINYKILRSQGLKRIRPKRFRNSRINLKHKYTKAKQILVSKGNRLYINKGHQYEGEKVIKAGNIRGQKLRQ